MVAKVLLNYYIPFKHSQKPIGKDGPYTKLKLIKWAILERFSASSLIAQLAGLE